MLGLGLGLSKVRTLIEITAPAVDTSEQIVAIFAEE